MSQLTQAARLLMTIGVAIVVLAILVRFPIKNEASKLADTGAIIVGILMVITGYVAIRIDAKRQHEREQRELDSTLKDQSED